MKGFFSFILIFLFLLTILLSLDNYTKTKSIDYTNALILEQKFYKEQELLHLISSTIKVSAQTVSALANEQNLELLSLAGPEGKVLKKVIEESEDEAIRKYVHFRLSELEIETENQADDWKSDFFCCPTIADFSSTPQLSSALGNPTKPLTCVDIPSPLCAELISVNTETKKVYFQSNSTSIPKQEGVIGFSLYSEKYGVASVSYLPIDYGVNY
jgi:hypothetical protein